MGRAGHLVGPTYAGTRTDGTWLRYAIQIFILFYVWFFIGIVTAIDLENTSGDHEALRTRRLNLIAFSARLTQNGVADRSLHFSIEDFRTSLEVEPDYGSKTYHKQGPQLDLYVPYPVIWLLLCGDAIFAHCRNPEHLRLALRMEEGIGREWTGFQSNGGIFGRRDLERSRATIRPARKPKSWPLREKRLWIELRGWKMLYSQFNSNAYRSLRNCRNVTEWYLNGPCTESIEKRP